MTGPQRVEVDAQAAGHALLALNGYRRSLEQIGEEPPAAFKDLAGALLFVARSGQTVPLLVESCEGGNGDDRRLDECLLSVGDAAAAVGVSVRSLRRRYAAGDLEVVRIGRRVKVRRGALDEFVARCEERKDDG